MTLSMPWPMAYLPLPASPEDWAAFMVFGGLAAFVAWRVYRA